KSSTLVPGKSVPIVDRAGQYLRWTYLVAADLDLPSQRILPLPESAHHLFADDNRVCAIRLVFSAKASAHQDRNAGRLKIVFAHPVPDRGIHHARAVVVIAGFRKLDAAAGHGYRNGLSQSRSHNGRQGPYTIQQLLKKVRRLFSRVSITYR